MTNPNQHFFDLLAAQPGESLPWLQALRIRGNTSFAETGLPTIKREEWKFTRMEPLENTAYVLATDEHTTQNVDLIPSAFDTNRLAARLVFVNGGYRDDLSHNSNLPNGVFCGSLRSAVAAGAAWVQDALEQSDNGLENPMISLNTAALRDGFAIFVPRGVVVDGVVEVVSLNGGTNASLAVFPRNVIVLEQNAQAFVTVHENGLGDTQCFADSVSNIQLTQNASLSLAVLGEQGSHATSFYANLVQQSRDSRFNSFNLSLGGGISRTEQHISLEGEGAECRLDGIYLMRGEQHCDHTTRVDHRVPHTTSNEMFKGVLDDRARAVFQGKIVVHPDAQQTDGQMLNKTILLGDGAEIDSKPELEIYADDVKCAHGATSGQLDETALFYLRTRGIPEHLARGLLVQSFVGEVVDRIADTELRDYVLSRIMDWLSGNASNAGEQA